MNLAAEFAAAGRELSVFKTSTCEIRRAADEWAAVAESVACHYEQTTPKIGAPVDYESGNGYGYTVWFAEAVEISAADTVTVDGLTISVQRIPEAGNLTPVTRIEGVVR